MNIRFEHLFELEIRSLFSLLDLPLALAKKFDATVQDAEKKAMAFVLAQLQKIKAEADKALADLRAKGMQVNELSSAEAGRMRDKLSAINTSIAANVGESLWKDVQDAVAQARTAK